MKTPLPRDERGFTLIELLLVVVVIAVLVAMLFPQGGPHDRAKRITCVNNLKQIGLTFRQLALDQNGAYPMTVSSARGGASEYVDSPADTWKIFGCMSNVLNTPKNLFCPAESDSQRRQAVSFTNLVTSFRQTTYSNNANLSYFVGVDAIETLPSMLLAGDHNLGRVAPPLALGPAMADYSSTVATSLQALGTNLNSIRASWTDGNHQNQGNVGLADGSVQQWTISRLRRSLADSGDPGRTNVIGHWHGEPPGKTASNFHLCLKDQNHFTTEAQRHRGRNYKGSLGLNKIGIRQSKIPSVPPCLRG